MAGNTGEIRHPADDDEEFWDDDDEGDVYETIDNAPVKVIEGIYIGSFMAEQNKPALQKAGVTHILQVAEDMENSHAEGFQYCNIEVPDAETVDLVAHFSECFQFIEKALSSKGAVLVHCVAGVSRSATVIIGYLMWKQHCGYDAAFKVLHSVRPWVCPNKGFKAQLAEFEGLGCDLTKWPAGWKYWKDTPQVVNKSAPDGIQADDFL